MRSRKFVRSAVSWGLTAAMALAAASCGTRQVRKTAPGGGSAKAGGPEASYAPGTEVTEASLRGSDFLPVEELKPIYFDYDSSALKDEALAALKKNARYLKDNPSLEARVSGFCDERGTVEYNLALGQKRAREVREYYIRLGVPGKSIATISYGKENQVCGESTEECWGKNRRGDTGIRAAKASP